VLQWLRSQDPPCPWDSNVCLEAVTAGDLDMLVWLRSQNPPCPWDIDICRKMASIKNFHELEDWILNNSAV
jgi:hypothetical protein